ncbi:aldehyde dehydrogenase family protein [Sandaracinobacter sp. RS1-74]|uniref:aldehyde dehydrogenase family protein n=1 Tax=Sandaracinobacteroides sayramensis TaxID=2913411 RepID=UPI001EDADCB0|nr:aldehyde dehydrogenase family protein [Sandaracinobacteroides sayramensis]MCG2840964.1 aldehyde dehydrogenase family protein [Sandaracinobacteroides sayramensis]
MDTFHLVIAGKLVAGAQTMPVVNPATEAVIAQCPRADPKQLDEAVSAAKAAFPGWSQTPIAERRGALMRVADEMEARTEELARLLTAEQGKPLDKALEEIGGSVFILRALASLELPEKLLYEDADGRFVEQRYPLGVVAAITPWNFPISLLVVKVPPALLAGNTVVAKPAPTTPLTSLRLAEILNRHLPPGVFNMIVDANDLGGQLTAHPDVAKISFTGSTATGRKVMASASSLLKRITLELGGNDAAIVLDDADPKATAKSLFEGAMVNSGQVCLAIKRAYVHESQYDAICDELAELSRQAIVGEGTQQGTEYGPLQNRAQYERVRELIDDAASRGKVLGGEELDRPGYFIRPAIIRDIDDDARIVREEQFGPVLPVLRYADIDDAVKRANDSEQGLGGTVWSADTARALEVASRLNTGMVWINSHMNINPFVPMGGAKQSGMGQELGQAGLEEFTQRRLVFVPA